MASTKIDDLLSGLGHAGDAMIADDQRVRKSECSTGHDPIQITNCIITYRACVY